MNFNSILESLARDPNIDPTFKRGVAMLLESGEKAVKPVSIDEFYATAHLSDTEFHDRQVCFEEVAKAHAAFIAIRDEFARLCRYWRVDAAGLSDATGHMAELAHELQAAVRKEFTRE